MKYNDCPLSEVADALHPFVRTRDEVHRVRRELQTYLEGQLRRDNVPLLAANLSSVAVARQDDPPSALSGARRAYWRSLQAHNIAQAKYDALKLDVASIHSEIGQSSSTSADTLSVSDDHIKLLRQREKQRKLRVLEKTIAAIDTAGNGKADNSLDDLVKQRLGDPPMPPSTSVLAFNEKPDADTKTLQLKKALLTAKHELDHHEHIRHAEVRDEQSPVPVEAEINGLQTALGELTSWMESQLVLIGNADTSNTSPAQSPTSKDSVPSQLPSQESIGQLYDDYLAARQRLINTIHSPIDLEQDVSAVSNTTDTENRRDSVASAPTAPEIVLAYLSTLARAKREEASLLQQSSFLRRQITSVEVDTELLVARLADESHLVHPGTTRGQGWAEAAAEAGKASEGFVRQRLEAGQAYAEAANSTLAGIRSVPRTFDGVAAD